MISRAEVTSNLVSPGGPYEIETIEARGRQVRWFRNGPKTLREIFEASVCDEEFLIYQDERQTFREAWSSAARLAVVLQRRLGVGKGDRVAIAMRNFPEWIHAFTAITSIGAVAVAVNALWQGAELVSAIELVGARVVLADDERLRRILNRGAPAGVTLVSVRCEPPDERVVGLSDLLATAGDQPMPRVDLHSDDLATIFFTSGSTGRAKGVPSTHRSIVTGLLAWELDAKVTMMVRGQLEPTERPVALLAIPLFHVTGSHSVYLASYRARRKIVAMYKWDPQAALDLIDREGVTIILAPSAVTGDLLRAAAGADRALPTLTSIGGGGASRSSDQVLSVSRVVPSAQPTTGWGMTETNALGVRINGPEYLARPTSSGRCAAVLDMKIVDDAGVALPPGGEGELLVRGASLFAGYWNDPKATAAAFVDDWFRTGDLAHFDDEGFLFITGRKKEVIIRGGENIGCGQVEEALAAFPAVAEAAVFAVPDERLGEEVGGAIYATSAPSPLELFEFLSERLAHFQIPKQLMVFDSPLPRTASGKIDKLALSRRKDVAPIQIRRAARR